MNRFETDLLLIPGPTPVPPPIARVLSQPMISHRGKEFAAVLDAVTDGLRTVFGTAGDVIVLAASGTGGMEAAIANVLSPGSRLLSVEIGVFGRRFRDIAMRYGCHVTPLEFPWGKAADPQVLAEALAEADPPYRAVTITQNETSTGVANPIKDLLAVVAQHGCLSIVDSISGLLAMPFEMDAWGADVVVGGSQKAFAIPPGLAFVAMSERAWEAVETAKSPKYYFDLAAMRASARQGQTAYTPAVGLMRALEVALDLLLRDGVEALIARHAVTAEATRAGIAAMGLKLFSDPEHASNAVTAILPPDGLSADAIRSDLSRRFRVILSGGQKDLKGRIFRIAHLGPIEPYQILGALAALEVVLLDQGHTVFTPGAGVAAAAEVFRRAIS